MYRVTRKSIRMGGKLYEPGDTVDISEQTADLLSDRVEKVTDESDLPFDPTELTNDEVEEAAQDVDDTEVLGDLLEAEQAGDDRNGAVEALEERIDELTE